MYQTKVNNRAISTQPNICHFLNQRFFKKKKKKNFKNQININLSKKLIKLILGNTAM